MECKHKSLENIHCFKCNKTHHEIVKELEEEVKKYKEAHKKTSAGYFRQLKEKLNGD